MGYLRTLAYKFANEQIQFVPAMVWGAYPYMLFVSDGILPGANTMALEQRTWEEVRDLSINVFIISPALHLPFLPAVHPMLGEGFQSTTRVGGAVHWFPFRQVCRESELVTVWSNANRDAIPHVRFFIALPVHEDVREKY